MLFQRTVPYLDAEIKKRTEIPPTRSPPVPRRRHRRGRQLWNNPRRRNWRAAAAAAPSSSSSDDDSDNGMLRIGMFEFNVGDEKKIARNLVYGSFSLFFS